jgi:hypothetical protein
MRRAKRTLRKPCHAMYRATPHPTAYLQLVARVPADGADDAGLVVRLLLRVGLVRHDGANGKDGH